MEVLLDQWTRDQENQEASAAISLTECLGHWLNMELDDYRSHKFVLLNVYGASELIPRNEFRQPM
jgi:hypothetical protein